MPKKNLRLDGPRWQAKKRKDEENAVRGRKSVRPVARLVVPAKSAKVAVTHRALLQRINRKLARAEEVLRVNRRGAYEEAGPNYWLVNFNRNQVVGGCDDLVGFGRELGVLKPYEAVEEKS